jgi:HEAT repeat protein
VKDPAKDNVRDLAIRCVKLLDLKQYMPTIRQYLYDKNEVIRIAAIVALSQWQDEQSRPAFEKAVNSKSVRLQRAGKAALKRLDEKKKPENHEKKKDINHSPTERVVF